MRKITKELVSAGAGLALLAGATQAETASAKPHDKVEICHATGSETNPYIDIEVSEDAAYNGHIGKDSGNQHGNHQSLKISLNLLFMTVMVRLTPKTGMLKDKLF